MFTKITNEECCTFLFDSPQRLSFWGKNTPQDLWLNCVRGGMVVESVFIESMSTVPAKSRGQYVLAFEALEPFDGSLVEFGPHDVVVS
jgi:uncharacterized membrane protein (UPF0127 family)